MRTHLPVARATRAAIMPIGFRRNGSPIWPVLGADDAATIEELVKSRNAVVEDAQKILTEADGKQLEGDALEKLRSLDKQFADLEAQLESKGAKVKDGDDLKQIQDRFKDVKARSLPTDDKRPPIYGQGGGDDAKKFLEAIATPGEQFVKSDAYRGWIARFPDGGPNMDVETFSQARDVGAIRTLLGLQDTTTKLRANLVRDHYRALMTSDDASAGELVLSLRRGLIEPGLTRPLTIRDLVTVIPVTTDTIEYVRENTRLQNAAAVAEATALTGTSGTKPEGGINFVKVTDTVKTIAEWVPLTKRILSDAPQLRAYVDQYLTYDLALELEDELITGAGGDGLTGILNTPLVLTQTGGTTQLHDLRMAKTKIRLQGRTLPTAIVMNPEDVEDIDLLRDESGGANTGRFMGADPFAFTPNQRIWGMPVVESEAVTSGTALVGDFNRAILFDRESTTISVGTAGDDFIRNIVRVLAELRVGFGVVRPKAFCIVTF